MNIHYAINLASFKNKSYLNYPNYNVNKICTLLALEKCLAGFKYALVPMLSINLSKRVPLKGTVSASIFEFLY